MFLRFATVHRKGTNCLWKKKDATEQVVALFRKQKSLFSQIIFFGQQKSKVAMAPSPPGCVGPEYKDDFIFN